MNNYQCRRCKDVVAAHTGETPEEVAQRIGLVCTPLAAAVGGALVEEAQPTHSWRSTTSVAFWVDKDRQEA